MKLQRSEPGTSLPHVLGLDGLRGIAILAVLLFHGGVPWATGGFLGVEAFFVLSGFLITSLLVAEQGATGTIRLGKFWARRARRLLPALICMVAVVGVYYALAGPAQLVPGLVGDGIAALFYYGNWHQIATGSSYFVATGPTSPFQHTWSLAIEEQFYILWPLLILGATKVARRMRGHDAERPSKIAIGVVCVGAVLSALEMAWLYGSGSLSEQTRVYYGTDTRAQGLLVGAALALLLRRAGFPADLGDTPQRTRWLIPAGLVALGALVFAMAVVNGQGEWLYRGGFLAVDVLAAAVIAVTMLHPASPAGRMLRMRPLVGLGIISYGLYIWHFPIFLWLTSASVGFGGTALLLLRLATSLGVAVVSYFLVEQPVRQRRLPNWLVVALAPIGLGTAALSLVIAANVPVAAVEAHTAVAARISKELEGTSSCSVVLRDEPAFGVSPVPAGSVGLDEYLALAREQVHWSGESTVHFRTCPPEHVLLVGDSIAFTLGVGLLNGEQRFGVELADAPLLGCSFGLRGELQVDGEWVPPPSACDDELQEWRADERQTHAQVVVVELGFRDSFDWMWQGHVVHLGDPTFDAYVESRIERLVRVLGAGGIPVVLLDVPIVDPPAGSNGEEPPQASPARHSEINQLLADVATRDPSKVHVLDLDPYIAPHNRYTASIAGHLCRPSDGIHFTPWCGSYVAPFVYRETRSLVPR